MDGHVYTTSMRKRSAAVAIGGVLAALALTACAGDERADYSKVCKEVKTNIRFEDDKCRDSGGGGAYVNTYVPSSHKAPAVGHSVAGDVANVPAGKTFGTVPAKGGFGTHAGTAGS